MNTPSNPVPIEPWIPEESLRLARTWPEHRAIVSAFFERVPGAESVPHMQARMEREALTLRLPPRRPYWLVIAASAMRTALATVPITIVALALMPGNAFAQRWNGDGFGLPASTLTAIIAIAFTALVAVALQVSADIARLRHEEESDVAFVSFQLNQFFQRANEYLASVRA